MTAPVPCHYCGKPVNTVQRGAFIEITGWAATRDQGGTNAVALRRPTGRAAHALCIDIAKHGGQQQAMEL